MVISKAKTPAEYLASLEPERRAALAKVRDVIKKNLPKGYKETVNWGMISYEVPLSRYAETYNGQPLMYAALASQKNHMALYLMCVYAGGASEKDLKNDFKKAGKKLDMGKSCIRFRKIEDLPLDAIARAVRSTPVDAYIRHYERAGRKAR